MHVKPRQGQPRLARDLRPMLLQENFKLDTATSMAEAPLFTTPWYDMEGCGVHGLHYPLASAFIGLVLVMFASTRMRAPPDTIGFGRAGLPRYDELTFTR